MMKKGSYTSKADAAINRLGNTTGASKGKAPLPKPKLKVKPTKGGGKAEFLWKI